MKFNLNPLVDKYLIDGCMRCKFGGTPQCKVRNWTEELETLRQIVLETGLKEEIKWGVPVYTRNGKNIVIIGALKESATIGFFKGVLLSDIHKILVQQGTLQSDRIIKFTNTDDINNIKDVLKEYILEAIHIEKQGLKVEFKKNPESLPNELLQIFENNPSFRKAFYALTLSRQRGYIIHFSQPKQAQTRFSRIEKSMQNILMGIGLNDKYHIKKTKQ